MGNQFNIGFGDLPLPFVGDQLVRLLQQRLHPRAAAVDHKAGKGGADFAAGLLELLAEDFTELTRVLGLISATTPTFSIFSISFLTFRALFRLGLIGLHVEDEDGGRVGVVEDPLKVLRAGSEREARFRSVTTTHL